MSRQNPIIHAHLSAKKHLTLFDKIIIFASFLYPLSGMPQVIEVFNGNTAGVSLLSWIGFIGCAGLFLAYGLIHKITPMIITNTLWLAVDGLVIVGLIAHSTTMY